MSSKDLSVSTVQEDFTRVNPDIHELFVKYDALFFSGKLVASGVECKWGSKSMTSCAGLCVFEGKHGLCSVRLSKPLLQYRTTKEMIETLLHEMIHAYLFVVDGNREQQSHGPKFKKFMNNINSRGGTNISVFHTFHDEVNHFKKHVWRCDGLCQKQPPFFGWVRRAINRAPGKNDNWWDAHQFSCGGTFQKVSEPEGYKPRHKPKRKAPEDHQAQKKQKRKSSNVCPSCSRTFVTTEAFSKHLDVCNLASTYSPVQCDRCQKWMPLIHECIPAPPKKFKRLKDPELLPCPICTKKFTIHELNAHANACIDITDKENTNFHTF